MKKATVFIILIFITSLAHSQMKKWVLGSSMVDQYGNFHSSIPGQLKFFEVDFSGATPLFSQRTLGASVNAISSVGIDEGMTSVTDTLGNIAFYAFPNCTSAYSGNSSDDIYLIAYDATTGKDEVFATIKATGLGASSAKEIEIVKRDGASNQYYLIYKTTCINTYANDTWRYVTVDMNTKTISAPTILMSNSLNEGMAVSAHNCSMNNRWLFFIKYVSGNLQLYRSSITGAGISAPVLATTIFISGNSSAGQGDIEISPLSDKIAIANFTSQNVNEDIIVLDLDITTGNVTNQRWINDPANYIIALEFSPDGKRLYTFQGGSSGVPTAMYNIGVPATGNYTILPSDKINVSITSTHSIEVGYDGLLYFTTVAFNTKLYCITNPNANAAANIVTTTPANSFGPGNAVGFALPDQIDGDVIIPTGTPITIQSASTSVCAGQGVTLWASGRASYLWSGGTSSSDSSVTVTPLTTTKYYLDTKNGCSNYRDSITITVNPLPIAAISGNTSICEGQSDTLTASGGITYKWNTGSFSTTNFIVVAPKISTTYTVITNDGTCNSLPTTIAVQVTPIPNVVISGPTTICNGASVTLNATGATSYQWSGGASSSLQSIIVKPATTTVYYVSGNNGNCIGKDTFTVAVAPIVKSQFTYQNFLCKSGMAFSNTSQNASTYSWSFGDGTTSVLTNPDHTYQSSGTYTISLIATSTFGCSDTSTITTFVTVQSFPIAGISSSDIDGHTFMIHDHSQNSTYCILYFGDGDSLTGCNWSDIPHTYKTDGIYTVTQIVSNSQGCADTSRITITVESEQTLFYPNSFTPDGNGLNDVFYIYGTGIQEFKLRIYNRWGELIFQSNDILTGWDGTYKGQPVEQDVYVWKLDYTARKSPAKQIIGRVTVLR